MIDISQLDPEQLEIIAKYQAVYQRVQALQTRMTLIETDLQNALKELEEIRNEEKIKQIINTHGKK
jgi:chaperonin cofactor prefoldin